MLYFGAPPGAELCYEKYGCQRNLQFFPIKGKNDPLYIWRDKRLLLKSIQDHDFESELSLYFNDNPNKYIIIICEDHCSFQRCGTPKEVNGEYNYESLDELYKAQQIDGIVLLLDVNKTEYIIKFTRNYYTAAGNAIIQAGYSSIINIPAGMAGARRWA